MNVRVRVLASRVTDGLLHPALCAGQVAPGGPLYAEDGFDSREVQVNRSAAELYSVWRWEPRSRKSVEETMTELFASVSWSQSLG